MPEVLKALEPRSVWQHFEALTRIPRPSGREEAAAAYVREVAKAHGFAVDADAWETWWSASREPGKERAPVVALQGPLDMVCEKNRDVAFDFERDPILPEIRGEWCTPWAPPWGRTNGIGVAAALAAATEPGWYARRRARSSPWTRRRADGAQGLDGSLLRARTP
jgi:dipeptidase D